MEHGIGSLTIGRCLVGIHIRGELIKCRGDDGSSGSITRATAVLRRSDAGLDGWVAHIPIGYHVGRQIGLREPEAGNVTCLLQISLVVGITIAHGESIESPSLATAPDTLVEKSLMREAFDDASIFRIIVDDVVRGIVVAEMVLHRGVGMVHSDVVELLVARDTRSLEEQFEVHHVVDDDGILPTAGSAPIP